MEQFPVVDIWYRLDKQDRIVEVSEDFDRVASENQGPKCRASEVVGQSLWSFVQGSELRHLLRLLLQQAEVGQVRVPLRCDAPDELRLIEMEIIPDPPHRLVRFNPVQTQPETPYDALEPARLVTLCSWCNNVEVTNGMTHWLAVDQAAHALGLLVREPQGITHGLCPECASALERPQDSEGFQHLLRGFRGI